MSWLALDAEIAAEFSVLERGGHGPGLRSEVVRAGAVLTYGTHQLLCQGCGQTFLSKRRHRGRAYCTARCYDRVRHRRKWLRIVAAREAVACGHCRIGFVPARGNGNQVYCTPACRGRANAMRVYRRSLAAGAQRDRRLARKRSYYRRNRADIRARANATWAKRAK